MDLDSTLGQTAMTTGHQAPGRAPVASPVGPEHGVRVAAIDVGSRNLKAVVGHLHEGRLVTGPILKEKLDLGEEVQRTGGIGPARLDSLRAALTRLRDYCMTQGASTVLAVATRAVRKAANAEQVIALARDVGIDLEVAPSEREGMLAYLAATGGADGLLVSDLGSQSLEIATSRQRRVSTICVPTGYEHAYSTFFEPAVDFTEARRAYTDYLAHRLEPLPNGTTGLVCLATKNAAGFAMCVPKEETIGIPLTKKILTSRRVELARLAPAAYRSLCEATPRIHKTLPGLTLVEYLLDRTGHDAATVSDNELPTGLIVEHLLINGCATSPIVL